MAQEGKVLGALLDVHPSLKQTPYGERAKQRMDVLGRKAVSFPKPGAAPTRSALRVKLTTGGLD